MSGGLEKRLELGVVVWVGFIEVVGEGDGELLLVLVVLEDGGLVILFGLLIKNKILIIVKDISIHFLCGGYE